MDRYLVTGMSCAACVARVEKAVLAVPGVTACAVSLLTSSMGVEGTAPAESVTAAVTAAGYGARPFGGSAGREAGRTEDQEALLEDRETPALRKRLGISLVLLFPLLWLSMGHGMWGWPVPAFLAGNALGQALAQMLLALAVMAVNRRFFVNGLHGLLNRSPNMDSLVGLGAGASFLWSLIVFFGMTKSLTDGDAAAALQGLHGLYFESAATILTLITVGKMLEARSKGRTTDALRSLMRLAPATALVFREGRETEVPLAEVRVDDTVVIRPGASVPVDAEVLEGSSAVNEASLTGESLPVDKAPGDTVHAGTINQTGHLRCRALRVGEDTTLAGIIRLVSDAAATKAPVARLADRVAGVFVPVVIGIAFLTACVWFLAGAETGYALARGIAVLVISCPCALGLATPVAIMAGSGVGARNGILFKTAAALEQAGKTRAVALDKTGTVTRGEPRVTDIIPLGCDEGTLLARAFALESGSEHPLARAVVLRAREEGLSAPAPVTDFQALPGRGLRALLDGEVLLGGSLAFVAGEAEVGEDTRERVRSLADEGRTPLLFALAGRLLGIIAVADVLREESRQAIAELRDLGLRVVLLTGDNERTAAAVARQAGVDEVIAGVFPAGKEKVIRELREEHGSVAMVGDGINDAPALTRADTGIAIGAGTDTAIDAADVVLMKSSLLDVPAAIRLSRATLRNVRENLFWAFIYNIIGIPVAAGALAPLWGVTLSPMFGAAAMSLSSFCVVSNALRLNLVNIRAARAAGAARPAQPVIREEKAMVMTVGVKGMMCPHCEKHMKEAFEKIDGVQSAACDHAAARAVLEVTRKISEEELRAACASAGYEYTGLL